MKTIIKRRADQLQPGDIISTPGHHREVVQSTINDGVTVKVHTAVIGRARDLSTKHHPPFTTFDVEVDQLTPAQQHADELVEMLWVFANLIREGSPAQRQHEAKIRALLAKINPPVQPPTLQEALDALVKLTDGAWDKHSMQPERSAAHEIISRARATGVLK